MTDLSSMSDEELLAIVAKGQKSPNLLATGEDIGKSAVSGLGKAAVNVAGFPGDVQALVQSGVDQFGVPPKAAEILQSPIAGVTPSGGTPLQPPRFPTSGEVQNKVEEWTGPFYQPKSGMGQAFHTLGEYSAGAAMPGGAVSRIANVLGPTIGSEGGAALAGPYGRVAGALIGGVAGTKGLSPLPARPERTAMANVLAQEGVPLTAGQKTGNRPLMTYEDAAADMPFSAGKAAKMQERTARAFSGAVMRRVGASGSEIATTDAVKRAEASLGAGFQNMSARYTAQLDPQIATDFGNVVQKYENSVLPSQRGQGRQDITTIIGEIADEFQKNGGALPGQVYQPIRSRLSQMSFNARESDPQLSRALGGIRDALDDAMGRSMPASERARWGELRTQWGNLEDLKQAMSGPGAATAEGFVSPSQLRTAVASNNRGAYATGQGDMSDLAHAGEAILRPLPSSGTAQRSMAMNSSLMGLVHGLAGRAILSQPVQAVLGNQLAPMTAQQARRRLVAQELVGRPEQSRE